MCGIGGIIRYYDHPVEPGQLRAMSHSLEHRGPDDQGALMWDGTNTITSRQTGELPSGRAGFIHRRLSILDLSEAGRQPMTTPDDRFHIVFNGEIYNYLELRQELIQLGHSIHTGTDTEVLLAAYAEWGTACLPKLIGMFAFAVLDTKKRTVFLARDFFGIKPLYWTASSSFFAFASELKGLLALDFVRPKANPQGVFDYLQHGRQLNTMETMYDSIHHLPAAHHLTLSLDKPGHPEPIRYWEADIEHTADISFEEAVAETRRLFLKNIELHLRSDVPLGCALSGGIDSSSIVSGIRHNAPEGELHAFSFVPDDPAISEEQWIETAGRRASATIHKVSIAPNALGTDFDNLLRAHDEPVQSSSIYAQYRVMQRAAEQGIKVMLDGQGGDEVLAGYQWYYGELMASLLRRLRLVKAARLYSNVGAMHGVTRARLLAPLCIKLLPAGVTKLIRKTIGTEGTKSWLKEEWFTERNVTTKAVPPPSCGRHILREELKRAVERDLPHLLRYEDRNSMAHSIESRVPFLTPEFVNFTFSLPEEYLIGLNGTNKRVFREAMRGLVPAPILDRRDKVGFPTPEYRWLKPMTPWLKGIMEGDTARALPFHHPDQLREEWNQDITPGSFSSNTWLWSNLIRWAELNNVTM